MLTEKQLLNIQATLDDGNNGQVYYLPKTFSIPVKVISTTRNSVVLNSGSHAHSSELDFKDFVLIRPLSDLFE